MAWITKGNKRPEPPARETLGYVAATILGVETIAVSVIYRRESGATTVCVRCGLLARSTRIPDSEFTKNNIMGSYDIWRNAVVSAAHEIKAKMSETAVKPAPTNLPKFSGQSQHVVSHQNPASSHFTTTMLATQHWTQTWSAWDDTISHPTVKPPPIVALNPKLPKEGEHVRDKAGRVIGVMCADGSVELLDPDVAAAIQKAEQEGTPVAPQVIRRAIDLNGKFKK